MPNFELQPFCHVHARDMLLYSAQEMRLDRGKLFIHACERFNCPGVYIEEWRIWNDRLRNLFELAKIARGYAHRFRDTFSVELLLAGVPIEDVSILLGHSIIRITQQHYAPWVRDRQMQLEASLKKVWTRDPGVLREASSE